MKLKPLFVVISMVSVLAPAAGQAQDAAAGQAVYNQCRPCHQVGENARNLIGPELNGLIGRKAGSVEGYSYSEANKNSGLTWDEATFKDYIANPRQKVPGTKMAFAGIKSEAQIQNLIAYLKTFAANGKSQ